MNNIFILFLSLFLLLCSSAFFSASETACTSLSKIQLRRLKKSRTTSSKTLIRLLSEPSKLLTTILIGNNIVNNWASSLATAFAISILGSNGIGVATAIMTLSIIIFGEILPKTIASRYNEKIASAIAPFLNFLEKLFFPLVMFFSTINNFFIHSLKRLSPGSSHRITEDELKTIIEVGRREGVIEEGEHRLLHKAWDFTDIRLREIMVPRTAMAAVEINTSISQVRTVFRTQRFSRMPVYSKTLDTMIGMIHYRDILTIRTDDVSTSIKNLVRPILFVPETQTASSLLQELKNEEHHMAIVIDEHGATSGLVTMRDAISAVFGGIKDEYDITASTPTGKVEVVDARYLRLPGSLKLDDLNGMIGTNLNSDFYETVGGFILEQAGKLPEPGERIRYKDITFIVEDIKGRKITRIGILLENKENQ
ncbi:MAG TPA: hemolysin family protein [Treponemataceae bacterium]|nr:hemolysin family protein [Treponemataceae bacterium]